MGCASSKRIEAAIDVYRPPPSGFGVFDINAIEEPWLKAMEAQQQLDEKEKPTHLVPAPLLEKLNAFEDAPRSWDEVSKALEDLKPTLHNTPTITATPPTPKPDTPPPRPPPKTPLVPTLSSKDSPNEKAQPSKSFSFHTLEELDAKLSSSKPADDQAKNPESLPAEKVKKSTPVKPELKKLESAKSQPTSSVLETKTRPAISQPATEEYKPVKENIFIVRDRLEREKEGKVANIVRFNPLSDFPEMCPPGGADSVVMYTTSLGGVRRTYEDCNKVRLILESHRFVFDERDVSLHGEFLNELRELLGEGVSVPRMFVKGSYLGGVDEVVNLNETGRLGRILNWARVERGVGRLGCEGCGGARFVPCFDCGGSCKVMVGEKKEKEKCPSCNENGLVLCPICD